MALILEYGDRAAREMSRRFGGAVADAAAIAAIEPGDRADGMVIYNAATQMAWGYDAASAAAAGAGVIVPTDAPATGRWLIHATGTGLSAGAIEASHVADAQVLAGAGAVGVVGVPFVIAAPFAAGITGAADDVLITDTVPAKCLLLEAAVVVTTNQAGETVTLRDAAAGGGTALSDAISVNAAGTVRSNHTLAPTLAASSDIYLRRSHDGSAGVAILTCLPIA